MLLFPTPLPPMDPRIWGGVGRGVLELGCTFIISEEIKPGSHDSVLLVEGRLVALNAHWSSCGVLSGWVPPTRALAPILWYV